jgi:hypothetical protein
MQVLASAIARLSYLVGGQDRGGRCKIPLYFTIIDTLGGACYRRASQGPSNRPSARGPISC